MTCPTCGNGQLEATGADANGMVACNHCGRTAYAGYVAEAAYLIDVRGQQDRRIDWLMTQVRAGVSAPNAEQARNAHAWPPPTETANVRTPTPASSAPLLLVLGTSLLVIAAMVFVAVVWNQIGAGGQALTLTAIVAGTAVLAVRLHARLSATAEALAVTSLAVLTIELLAAPNLGILPFDVLDWGSWYHPAALGVVALAGLVGGKTYRLQAWNVLGWLAIAPATGFLALAVARHADFADPSHATGYGALAAIVIGLALLRIDTVLPQLAPPWSRVSGTALLLGSAVALPTSVAVHDARAPWLFALGATCVVMWLIRAFATTSSRGWDVGTGGVLGLTAALALLPDHASQLGWGAAAAGLGTAALGAGVMARRIDIGHTAAGVLWAAWLGGRLIQSANAERPDVASQVVLLAAVAGAVLLADAIINHRPVLAWVAAAAGITAAATATGHAEVHLLESYTLPAAALLLVAGLIWRHQVPSNSYVWFGPAAAVALLPSAWATWMAPWNDIDFAFPTPESKQELVRLVLVIALASVAAIIGARLRWGGLLLPASLALGLASLAQIWATAHVLPKWVVLASVGAALIVAGARLEWLRDQRTRLDDWAERLA